MSIPRCTPWNLDHRDGIVPCELYARGDFWDCGIWSGSVILVYSRESSGDRIHLGVWDIVLSLGQVTLFREPPQRDTTEMDDSHDDRSGDLTGDVYIFLWAADIVWGDSFFRCGDRTRSPSRTTRILEYTRRYPMSDHRIYDQSTQRGYGAPHPTRTHTTGLLLGRLLSDIPMVRVLFDLIWSRELAPTWWVSGYSIRVILSYPQSTRIYRQALAPHLCAPCTDHLWSDLDGVGIGLSLSYIHIE